MWEGDLTMWEGGLPMWEGVIFLLLQNIKMLIEKTTDIASFSSLVFTSLCELYWAREASPTLGCSIEISSDICMYIMSVCLVCQINCVGGIM